MADSRSYSFERYSLPASYDINIDYIIKRGATVQDLLSPTLSRLRHYISDSWVIVKVAAGINNLTEFSSRDSRGKRVLKPSRVTSHELFNELERFKHSVLATHPKSIVSFATIPPASFLKFQQYRNLRSPIFTAAELSTFQHQHNITIDAINRQIKEYNRNAPNIIQPWNLSWHTSIRKADKRRSRSGRPLRRIRNNFTHLYDGLHAISSIKRKWHIELVKSFSKELQALQELN